MEGHAGQDITAAAMAEAVSTEVAIDPSEAAASHSPLQASVATTVLPLVDPGAIRHLSDLQDEDTHGEEALPREVAIDPSPAASSHSPDQVSVPATIPQLAGPEHIGHSGDLQDEDTQGEEAVSSDVATDRSAAATLNSSAPASVTATVSSLAGHAPIRHLKDLQDEDTQGEQAVSGDVATDRSVAAASHSPAPASVTPTEPSLADLGPVRYLSDLQDEDAQGEEVVSPKVATTPSAPADSHGPAPTSVTATELLLMDLGPVKHLSDLHDEETQGKGAVSTQVATISLVPADSHSPAPISLGATELLLVDPGTVRHPRDFQDEDNWGEREEGAVGGHSGADLPEYGLIDGGKINLEGPPAFPVELSSVHGKLKEAAEELEVAGRVVYSGRPGDGVTVKLAGVYYGAAVEVVERSDSQYQLIVSVKATVKRSPRGRDHNVGRGQREVVAEGAGRADTVTASLVLGKSQLKAVLQRWIFPSTTDSAAPKGVEPPFNTRGDERDASADKALRRWISTGRAPRRAHLVRWLLRRLELVEQGTDLAQNGEEQDARIWGLVISNVEREENNATDDAQDVSNGGTRIRQGIIHDGTEYREGVGRGEGIVEKHGTLEHEDGVPRSRTHSEKGVGRWWNDAYPWERGSTPTTTASEGKSAASQAPALGEPAHPNSARPAPPPYYEAVLGTCTPRSKAEQGAPPPPTAEVMKPAVSQSLVAGSPYAAYFPTRGTRGPPPSYHSPSSEGTSGSSARTRDKAYIPRNIVGDSCLVHTTGEDQNMSGVHARRGEMDVAGGTIHGQVAVSKGMARPPSYEQVYGEYADTARVHRGSHHHRYHGHHRTDADVLGLPQHDTHRHSDRERERERERARERRRRGRTSSRDKGFSKSAETPETTDERLRSSWRNVGARKSSTAVSGRRGPGFGQHPEQRGGGSKPSSRGTEDWDDDRWRLTAYLESCERELTEAEERRRRAEAVATAAERAAWKNAGKGGVDETVNRAWARVATQRVLDLMLVTERVRQEEQKRRVAATRANEQVARCKQPYRERRGRSQKGPCIGPIVPPTRVTEPPRDPRMETALNSFYWDEHGRRYHRRAGGEYDRGSGEVGAALEAVRQVAAFCLEEGTDFRQPFRELDADGDGHISLAELGAALRRAGARLGLSQVTALFRHFDRDNASDTVACRDVVWEFVNKRNLLNQWRKAGDTLRGGRRARNAVFRNRAKTIRGGDGGTLMSRQEFYHTLDDLELRVEGWEAEAVLDRFAVHEEGQIDWQGFVSFLQDAEDGEDDGNDADKNVHSGVKTRRRRDIAPPKHRPDDTSYHRYTFEPATGGNVTFQGPRGVGTRDESERRREGSIDDNPISERHGWRDGEDRFRGGLFERGATWSAARPPAVSASRFNKPARRARTVDADKTGGRRQSHLSSPLPPKVLGGTWTPISPRSRGEGGVDGTGMERGKGVIGSVAAMRMLDDLLEDQQELEDLLEEELARREGFEKGEDAWGGPAESQTERQLLGGVELATNF